MNVLATPSLQHKVKIATLRLALVLAITRSLISFTAHLAILCGLLGMAIAAETPSDLPVAGRFPHVSELPSKPEFPDPLVMLDGRRVTTREQWFNERRPELIALFQHYMYGFLPPAPRDTVGKIVREDRKAFE